MHINTYLNKTTIDRFWEKVKKLPNGCWEWQGSKSKGYGQIESSGKAYLVHRFSYWLHNGELPKGKGWHGICVCHSCDNRFCVNPAHLWLGTHDDNMKDAQKKGKFKGENAGRSKLTEKQVKQIRKLLSSKKLSQREIAKMFNISRGSIDGINRKLIWNK